MVAAVGYEITTRNLRINCTGPKVIGYTDTRERSERQEIINSQSIQRNYLV